MHSLQQGAFVENVELLRQCTVDMWWHSLHVEREVRMGGCEGDGVLYREV